MSYVDRMGSAPFSNGMPPTCRPRSSSRRRAPWRTCALADGRRRDREDGAGLDAAGRAEVGEDLHGRLRARHAGLPELAGRGELFLLGVALALIGHIPLVGFLMPVYGGLAFIHYGLARLGELRSEPIQGEARRV